jgi:hypothetical protein
VSDKSLTVRSVTGHEIVVQHPSEVDWYNRARDAYTAETHFEEQTDLADLDRLLAMELSVFRSHTQLTSGVDYDGDDIDPDRVRRDLREMSDAITKLKTAMGLTRASRDAAANNGDFATWLAELKHRGQVFGIHREKQLTAALTLMNELAALVGTYDRADAEERRRIGFEDPAAIVDWIRTTLIPEFEAVDAHFRTNIQAFWTEN